MTDATEVRNQLNRLKERGYDSEIDGFNETLEEFTEAVVGQGQFTPDKSVYGDVSLTLRERLNGRRRQDFTGAFALGMMIGAALERDIPKGSDAEQKWRNGEFELPGDDGT